MCKQTIKHLAVHLRKNVLDTPFTAKEHYLYVYCCASLVGLFIAVIDLLYHLCCLLVG